MCGTGIRKEHYSDLQLGYQRMFHTGHSSKYFNDQPLWTRGTQISREERVTACSIVDWIQKDGLLPRNHYFYPLSIHSLDILSSLPNWYGFFLWNGWKCWLSSFLHRPSSNCRDSAALSDRTMIRRILQMRGKLNLFASLELGSLWVNIYISLFADADKDGKVGLSNYFYFIFFSLFHYLHHNTVVLLKSLSDRQQQHQQHQQHTL